MLIIVGAVCAWVSLYQGIVAFGSPAVREDELVTVTGLVRHVETPVMRNRQVPQLVLQIEVAPTRMEVVPVPMAALPIETARTLIGETVTIIVARLRPRNRWAYDVKTATRQLVTLAEQRAHDAARRMSHLRWMIGMGMIAAAVFAVALLPHRTRIRA